jgi:hypothetical protein
MGNEVWKSRFKYCASAFQTAFRTNDQHCTWTGQLCLFSFSVIFGSLMLLYEKKGSTYVRLWGRWVIESHIKWYPHWFSALQFYGHSYNSRLYSMPICRVKPLSILEFHVSCCKFILPYLEQVWCDFPYFLYTKY